MPDIERIKEAFKWLKFQGYAASDKDIADTLGYTKSSFSQIMNEKVPLSEKFINKVSIAYPVLDANWLQTGEGSMLKDSLPRAAQNDCPGVPYYDLDVTATITESFTDVKEDPEFFVDFRPFNDCAAYLPIYGDSMYPTFASGEIIAVKQLTNPDVILWGEAHLVITNAEANNMKTVKLLFPHEDENKIILRASNPNFRGDTVIPKSSILNIYIVKGKITRKQL